MRGLDPVERDVYRLMRERPAGNPELDVDDAVRRLAMRGAIVLRPCEAMACLSGVPHCHPYFTPLGREIEALDKLARKVRG